MSEALSDVVSSVREHLPSADVVRDHLPSLKDLKEVDTSAITDRLPKTRLPKTQRKWPLMAVLLGAAAAIVAVIGTRMRRQPTMSASMYTPPLPKP